MSGKSGAGGRSGQGGTSSDGAGPVPADRSPDELSRFVERFASELAEAGMQRMAARVFAALLSSETASMTSAELALALQISPAAVSGAIRYLSQVDMVSREREPGSRRDRYVVHNEIWYESLTRRDQLLARWEKLLREGAETLGGVSTPAGLRLVETAEFMHFLQGEMQTMLERWRAHRATLDLPPVSQVPPVPPSGTSGDSARRGA
ncbi:MULTISPECIES: GbsR/MarR family transcriptional regulator [Streptomyces]|uniref:MarR family transcriptional regulator n=1 Tax=Streptomyces morookaense TaxID=1970 RepID=A0A7Y7B7V3_STRMO|nr:MULTISPECIES: MarR family transcriptional regulator [Streptomyces]MCC2279855.1 MarR family transcriptional regulator [Streptomyces sp. ET3-23]NVK80515.1 MarR family transcriptional regulator [Streptomyces morookaense]GHF46906.1 hypothetical protein GCM10010359_56750 [Streptomyces morookaense]